MTASAWVGLVELLVVTWSMPASLPPLFQPLGVPLVWSRLTPSSKFGLGQKLPARRGGWGGGAIVRSSISMTPTVDEGPPDTSDTRILTPPGGTTNAWLRLVNAELAIVPCQHE